MQTKLEKTNSYRNGEETGQGGGGSSGGTSNITQTNEILNITNLDNLINESEVFLEQIQQISLETNNSNTSSVLQATKKFRQWRSKRRDEKLLVTMNSLLPRIKSSEELLRDTIIQIVEKKLALRDQARHLKYRLDACIAYNAHYIDSQEEIIDEMRNSVNALSTESSLVKAMVAFNVELVRQKVMETVRNNRTFVSWGSKAVLLRPISEQELSEDADHPTLMSRLNTIRECREQLVLRLSSLLEVRESHMLNLENSSQAHKSLVDLLASSGEDMNALDNSNPKKSSTPNNNNNTNGNGNSDSTTSTTNGTNSSQFNHDQCHDCSYVQMITTDCITHLNLLTKQTVEASQRLLQLVELRERVRDSAEFLRIDEADLAIYEDTVQPPPPPSNSTTSPKTDENKRKSITIIKDNQQSQQHVNEGNLKQDHNL